ncbi:MAG: DUF1018 domain-containing protein [Bacillota bacterium]|nr:DUF1018 domain-containing protein [Bacillota bacterium]
MAKEKTFRERLIGLIHMQKSAAQLSDEDYRLIVAGATGKQSCSECNIQELFAIHNDLNAVLIKQGKKRFVFHRTVFPKKKNTIQDAVLYRAKRVLGDNWKERLDGYLQKINKTSVYSCSNTEIRQIMGWISTVEKRSENAK